MRTLLDWWLDRKLRKSKAKADASEKEAKECAAFKDEMTEKIQPVLETLRANGFKTLSRMNRVPEKQFVTIYAVAPNNRIVEVTLYQLGATHIKYI